MTVRRCVGLAQLEQQAGARVARQERDAPVRAAARKAVRWFNALRAQSGERVVEIVDGERQVVHARGRSHHCTSETIAIIGVLQKFDDEVRGGELGDLEAGVGYRAPHERRATQHPLHRCDRGFEVVDDDADVIDARKHHRRPRSAAVAASSSSPLTGSTTTP